MGAVFVEDGHSVFVHSGVAPSLAPFRVLAPGYRVGRLLEPEIEESEIWAEEMRASGRLNTEAIRAWHQGLVLIRPLAGDGRRAGIRKSASARDAEYAGGASERLRAASERLQGFTTIELYLAMARLSS